MSTEQESSSYILQVVPELGLIEGFPNQQALLAGEDPTILYSHANSQEAAKEVEQFTKIFWTVIAQATLTLDEETGRVTGPFRKEIFMPANMAVQLGNAPTEAIRLRSQTRFISTMEIGNLALVRRQPTEEESSTFAEQKAIADKELAETERRNRIGSKYLNLVDIDHLEVSVTNRQSVEQLYILPLGDASSFIAARVLLLLSRHQTKALGGIKMPELTIAGVAKQILDDMSEEERALTLTRDWQHDAKTKNHPLQGNTERILKKVMVGMGLVATRGAHDYAINSNLVNIRSSDKPFDPTKLDKPAKMLLSPDAEITPAEDDVNIATALLDALRVGLGTIKDQGMIIKFLDLVMTIPGKDALAAVATKYEDVDASLTPIHNALKQRLGKSTYDDALSNRTIKGNTTTGGRGFAVQQVSGRLPDRTKHIPQFGDRRPWRFEEIQPKK